MKIAKWFALIVIIAGLSSCVSPFYGTARIEPGFHVNVGAAVGQFTGPFHYSGWTFIGPRGDVEVGYAFGYFFKTHIRAGGGWGWFSDTVVEGEGGLPNYEIYVVDAAIGIQAAYPHKYVTPAFRIEGGLGGLTSDLLVGIGEREWLTLGTRVYFHKEYPENIKTTFAPFVGIHPIKHLSIFASPGGFTPFEGYTPYFTFGVGYHLR